MGGNGSKQEDYGRLSPYKRPTPTNRNQYETLANQCESSAGVGYPYYAPETPYYPTQPSYAPQQSYPPASWSCGGETHERKKRKYWRITDDYTSIDQQPLVFLGSVPTPVSAGILQRSFDHSGAWWLVQ